MEHTAAFAIQKLIAYMAGDAKRINHALKVYALAKSLGELENLPAEKQIILELAAVFHDIGIRESEKKYASAAAKYQEEEGPPVARSFLKELNVPEQMINRVCFLIGSHHTYGKIDDLDFQILVEADFLVNIFEVGMKKEQIDTIKQTIFKTSTGRMYLEQIYSREDTLGRN